MKPTARRLVADAVKDGQLAGLVAMRDKLAADMDAAEPSFVAQIAARLQSVLAQIDALAPPKEASRFDDLAKRRAERVTTSDDAAPPRRPAKQRSRRGG